VFGVALAAIEKFRPTVERHQLRTLALAAGDWANATHCIWAKPITHGRRLRLAISIMQSVWLRSLFA
jgi:hypothetical protein